MRRQLDLFADEEASLLAEVDEAERAYDAAREYEAAFARAVTKRFPRFAVGL